MKITISKNPQSKNHKTSSTPRLGKIAIIIGGLLCSSQLLACTWVAGYSPNTQMNVSFGNIFVSSTAPVGSVVASIQSDALALRPTFIINCNPSSTQFIDHDYRDPGLPAVAYGGQTLYQSGVPGFAIRIVTPGQGYTTGLFGSGNFPRILRRSYCGVSGTYCGDSFGPVIFELVKINATTGVGTVSSGTLIRTSLRNWNYISTFSSTGGRVVRSGCAVNNPSIPVPFNDVRRTYFGGIGSSSDEQSFHIDLQCDANTNISLQIDGTADSSGRQGTLALNPDPGVATGVGVEVLYNNAPVTLGSKFPVGTPVVDGPYSVTLSARYTQTQATITPGPANATATFTMSYN